MAKNTSQQNVQEIVMATSDKNESARRTAMLKEGTLRKIAPKVYTTTMDEAPEVIIKRICFMCWDNYIHMRSSAIVQPMS